jgi:serine/threonine protein kinase
VILRIRVSHYELIDDIGRDGPTVIYRARDLRLERDVAVKLLRPEEAARPAAVDRFRREARIASLVTHPHICAVHDTGEEGGQPFLVCELLEGRALDEVNAGSPQPLDRVLEVGIQLADALAAAHRRGVVHGNIKPSNVFITNDGHTKLLELGAALATAPHANADDAGVHTTSVKLARTTPAAAGEFFHRYISPEQIAGSGDHRSDLFATGALL